MATTIAKYYLEEIEKWNESINFYQSEIHDLNNKLIEIYRRDGIPALADRIQAHQILINETSKKFSQLQTEMRQQYHLLKSNDFIENKLVIKKIEDKQAVMRLEMQNAEKDYVDVKYRGYDFLSQVLI